MPHPLACLPTLLTLLAVATVDADTIEVCASCEVTSIRSAIDAADDGDIIQLYDEVYAESGRIDMRNKAITLRGAIDAEGAPLSRVDGSGNRGVFRITRGEGPDTRLENLIIQNGDRDEGGGVEIDGDSDPTFVNCIFQDNQGTKGAGVYINSASATFQFCVFRRNDAEDEGGALHLNSAEAGVLLEDCQVTENDAKLGAGLWCNSADVQLTRCTVTKNDADDDGGGLYSNSTDLDLLDTIVCENTPNQIAGDWDDEGGNCVENACTNCDFDRDGDGTPDSEDGCPDDPEKVEPGECGCGQPDTDEDGDLIADCIDECPNDADNDADGDGSCEDTPCFGDLDSDWVVGGKDLAILLEAWSETDSPADLNQDGIVDPFDLAILLGTWGVCP